MPFAARALLLSCLTFAALAQGGETTVTQSRKTFDPDAVTVQRGDVVHFENADDVKHNIQVSGSDDATQDLGLQKPGETVSHTFTHPGEYRVHCSIHPKMRLKVVVE